MTTSHLRAFVWRRVVGWLRKKHRPGHLEGVTPPLLARVVSYRGQGRAIQPGVGALAMLPLPRTTHPHALEREERLAGS